MQLHFRKYNQEREDHLDSCVHVAGVAKVLQTRGHLHCLADLVLVHVLHKPGKQGFFSSNVALQIYYSFNSSAMRDGNLLLT